MQIAVSGVGTCADEIYQQQILQSVSRTFALTIPILPQALSRVVSNAYLLCRIADTVEDESSLSPNQKHEFSERFIEVLAGTTSAAEFANELYPLLSRTTLEPERDLIKNTPRIIRLTESFSESQRSALRRCIDIMARGMSKFQKIESSHGLEDMPHLDRYCYHVAGVVGEMLTELFCDHVEAVAPHRETLMRLAVSFGQGLQMTNILKDIWEDYEREACWLPQSVFQSVGCDLGQMGTERANPAFALGIAQLIAVAQSHLCKALEYTLYFPAHEIGIRRFCLWALGMAVLTLRKISANPHFRSGKEVKISRRSVKLTVLTTNLMTGNDTALRLLFRWFTRGLLDTTRYGVTSCS